MNIHSEIIDLISRLDNGSHASSQLQATDEALLALYKKHLKFDRLKSIPAGILIGVAVTLLVFMIGA